MYSEKDELFYGAVLPLSNIVSCVDKAGEGMELRITYTDSLYRNIHKREPGDIILRYSDIF
jgi:hypothetical protein